MTSNQERHHNLKSGRNRVAPPGQDGTLADQPVPRVVRGVGRGHVIGAVKVLREQIAEPWTLQALAAEVHLSRSQLVRAFDATTGMSPMVYLRRMRVERMARLLASTDLSVAEAARSVGWKNQFHASQTFHAHYGISPTEYRRRQSAPPLD